MNFITKQVEKKLGVDLDGDGVIGSTHGHRYAGNYHSSGRGGGHLVGKLEQATHIDFNKDGLIGRPPNYAPHFHPSGGGGGGMINELEKATNIDLDGDGRIGCAPNYPPSYRPGNGPGYRPSYNQSSGSGGGGMINELEKATNIDLDGDGRIGGASNRPPNFQPYGGSSYLPPPMPYNGPNQPPNFNQSGSGMINELEKATNIDLNKDGRIGGAPNYSSNFQPYGGPSYPPPPNSYNGPNQPPNFNPSGGGGGSLFDELEKATNIDFNRDGRIGGTTNYPSNFQSYGGPSYPPPPNSYNGPNQPPNFNPSGGGGSGMINELEKATNIDLNKDGRIGGAPNYPSNFQPYSGPSYPPPPNPYNGPNQPPNFNPSGGGGSGMINELEKATNIDLNKDGRIGGAPNYPSNFQPYSGPSYPPPPNPYNGPNQPPNFNPSGGGGGSLFDELEKATNIDFNRDGRIGGTTNYPSNYNSYGYQR